MRSHKRAEPGERNDRAGGRAVAFTLDSIADCQAEMGIEPEEHD
jgi:hypothetical protein